MNVLKKEQNESASQLRSLIDKSKAEMDSFQASTQRNIETAMQQQKQSGDAAPDLSLLITTTQLDERKGPTANEKNSIESIMFHIFEFISLNIGSTDPLSCSAIQVTSKLL